MVVWTEVRVVEYLDLLLVSVCVCVSVFASVCLCERFCVSVWV